MLSFAGTSFDNVISAESCALLLAKQFFDNPRFFDGVRAGIQWVFPRFADYRFKQNVFRTTF